MHTDGPDARLDAWLAALEARHLADFTPSEVGRALRALSSCYVERRTKLAEGGALGTAGKRAAFALFYAPLHLLVVRHILRSLPIPHDRLARIQDLGCGTGSAGAAWGLEAGAVTIAGVDRHPWAVAEANWTYAQLRLSGRAVQQDVARARIETRPGTGIIAAYTINELPNGVRDEVRQRLLAAHAGGASVLVIEPIARGVTPWWRSWESAFAAAGGRADEWRFTTILPARQRGLGKAAGLEPRELTARTLFMGPAHPVG